MRKTLVRAVLAVVLAAAAVVAGSSSPAFAALAPTNANHPYSDPFWYPMRVAGNVDCIRSNPGCPASHTFWGFTMTPGGQDQRYPSRISHAGVYAMGAGILHIGDAHGTTCDHGANWGTWVWIDHGGSVASKYTHLSQFFGRDGQRVAPGQRIGTVGTTGKNGRCNLSYTDVIVTVHGAHGTDIAVPTMIACHATTRQVWPRALYRGKYSVWNQVPVGGDLPAVSSRCLPTTIPVTALHPTISAARAGGGALTLRWSAPPAFAHVGTVQVKLSRSLGGSTFEQPWHSRFVSVGPTKRAVTVTGLSSGRLYSVAISFHGSGGWSTAGTARITTS